MVGFAGRVDDTSSHSTDPGFARNFACYFGTIMFRAAQGDLSKQEIESKSFMTYTDEGGVEHILAHAEVLALGRKLGLIDDNDAVVTNELPPGAEATILEHFTCYTWRLPETATAAAAA